MFSEAHSCVIFRKTKSLPTNNKMPRPQNITLREYFKNKNESIIICENGKCQGKEMVAKSGNLERHLKTFHPTMYAQYLLKKNNKPQNKSVKATIHKEVYKNQFEENIVKLFTKNGRPFTMIDDEAFKFFVQPYCDAFKTTLNNHNLHQLICQYCSAMQDDIIRDMNGKLISLKIDAATRLNLSALGINVQYFKNNKIIIKTLAVKELKASHTSSYLKNILYDVLRSYKINLEQILTVTTDNGANMIRTVKDMNNDLAHNTNEWEGFNVNSLDIMDSVFSEINITNIRCGAHTLQLCVNDFIKKEDCSKKIEELRGVARKLRSPTYKYKLIEARLNKPILDCPTRWNSTYKMIERLLELKPFIQDLNIDISQMGEDMWLFAEQILTILQPIYIATTKLQSEDLCYSDLYIIIMDVILKIERLPDSSLKTSMINCLQCRKAQLLQNDLCNAAVFLDPRIRVYLNAEEKVRAKTAILSLHDRILRVKSTNPTVLLANLENDRNMDQSSCANFFDLIDSIDPHCSTTVANIVLEMVTYEQQPRLPSKTNVLQYWGNQNSNLASIAKAVLAIPPTQVTVERLFSSLKYILSDDRNRMSPYTLEQTLLLRTNGVNCSE